MPKLMQDDEITARLDKLDGWKRDAAFITKEYKFKSFKQAMKFVKKVADVAEDQDHHPDINIRYDVVRLSVQTHSEGGLTKLDFNLAREIDRIPP